MRYWLVALTLVSSALFACDADTSELPVFEPVFSDSLSSATDWELVAEPDVACTTEDRLCGNASAAIEDGALRLSAGCDSIDNNCPAPAARAIRSLSGLESVAEFKVTADFARLGGTGTLRVCLTGRCATVVWAVEEVDEAGIAFSRTETDLQLLATESLDSLERFTISFADDDEANDGVVFEIDAFRTDFGIWYESIVELRTIEVHAR